MTPSQMQERRNKGLCYYCDEKFTRGHKCAHKSLLLLEGECSDDEEDILLKPQREGTEQNQWKEEPPPAVSIQAMFGCPTPRTIRLMGVINKKQVAILLDTGSTHNFVDPRLVKRTNMQTQAIKSFDVNIAGDEKLSVMGLCKDVTFMCQGHPIVEIIAYYQWVEVRLF